MEPEASPLADAGNKPLDLGIPDIVEVRVRTSLMTGRGEFLKSLQYFLSLQYVFSVDVQKQMQGVQAAR